MPEADSKFPRQRPLAPPRVCGACGHALGALPLNEPCPACGWRPSVRCITCGYDLAGLPEDGPCPECATPIDQSLRGDGLAFSSEAYLRTLDRGLWLTRLGVGLLFAVWIGSLVLGIVVAMLTSGGLVPWLRDVLVIFPSVACIVVWCVGWWITATPDPRLAVDGPTRAQLGARLLAIAAGLVLSSMLISQPFITIPVPSAGLLLGALLIAHYACGAVVLRRLAQRAGNRRAAGHARRAWWASMIVAGCVAAQVAASVVFGHATMSPGVQILKAAWALASLTVLLTSIVAIVRQATAAGLIRDDLRRFLFHARGQGANRAASA